MENESRRSERGQYMPGGTGNPLGLGGRPKEHVAGLARQRTEEAIDTLVHIMQDPKASASARASAASVILDRGYGKPVLSVAQADMKGIEAALADAPEEGLTWLAGLGANE